MNADLLDAVKQIVSQQGEAILLEPRRVTAFLSDLAREVPRPPKTVLVKCLEHGYVKFLKEAPASERANIRQKLSQRLHEEEGLDLTLCKETLDLLTAVLFGEAELAAERTAAKAAAEAERLWAEAQKKAETQARQAQPAPKPQPVPKVQQSASSSSSSQEHPVVQFLMDKGFEDADFPGYGINLPLSIIISLAITACISYLVNLIIPGSALVIFFVSLALSFMAFYLTHVKLRIILGVIAGIGLIAGIINFNTSPQSAAGNSGAVVTQQPAPPAEALTPFQQAVNFYDNEQYDRAAPLFQTLADEGHAGAQGYLGYCFYFGYGVTQDYFKAIEWWNKAADQGNARSQYGLGYAYTYGLEGVVAQDYAKAVDLLTKAAEQGHDGAQYTLGRCYQNGWGIPRDYDQAEVWYRKAADQGNEQAKNALNDWSFLLRDTL